MAEIDAEGIDGENRNERKAKGATHHSSPPQADQSFRLLGC